MSTMPKWPTRLLNHIILSLRIVQIIGVAGFLVGNIMFFAWHEQPAVFVVVMNGILVFYCESLIRELHAVIL